MKRLILAIIILFSVGCFARVCYVNPNGEKFSYWRLGSMKLSDFHADVGTDTKTISIGSSEGKAGDLATALKNLSEVAKKGAGIP